MIPNFNVIVAAAKLFLRYDNDKIVIFNSYNEIFIIAT